MNPELKKKLEAFEAEAEARRTQMKPPPPYNPRAMNVNRMPLGCWVWVIAMVAGVLYLAKKYGIF